MKYTIENDIAIIKHGIFTHKLDLRQVTSVSIDQTIQNKYLSNQEPVRITFYDRDAVLFTWSLNNGLYELSKKVYDDYSCEQIAFDASCFPFFVKDTKEDSSDIDRMEQKLNVILEEAGKDFPFTLRGEIKQEETSIFYRIWGEQNGREIKVPKDGELVSLDCPFPLKFACVINKDPSKNVWYVFDDETNSKELELRAKHMLRFLRQMIRKNGWSDGTKETSKKTLRDYTRGKVWSWIPILMYVVFLALGFITYDEEGAMSTLFIVLLFVQYIPGFIFSYGALRFLKRAKKLGIDETRAGVVRSVIGLILSGLHLVFFSVMFILAMNGAFY